jgi:5-methyltetrahydrofolate--homocysteine methyltransferase
VPIEWTGYVPPTPEFLGVRAFADVPLDELVPYIDWTPFFHTWELAGRFPAILDDPIVGEEARRVYGDARKLLDEVVAGRALTARAVVGLFAANAVGDDIEVYADETRSALLARLFTLRQQVDKGPETINYALGDFVAPKETGLRDYVGAFAVTAGHGMEAIVQKYKADLDDYNAIMVEALADRLVEACAERMHKLVRDAWGYGRDEALTTDDFIAERYRGIRPAPGYPACPDHTEKETIWRLLDVERNAGMKLTESFAMYPASSVSGLYFSHPEARYFPVGKIERDQVEEYAARRGWDLATAEKWLAPNLNYEPSKKQD